VSVTFDRLHGLAIVATTMDGPARSVKVRLLLDTGSAYSIVRPRLLRLAGYNLDAPRSRVPIATVTDVIWAPLFVVSAVRAIEVERHNSPVLAQDIPPVLAFDGVLGASFFRGRRLIVDFTVGTASLE